MFTYTKEILKILHMFPSHYLLPQVTKIKVIDLGIKKNVYQCMFIILHINALEVVRECSKNYVTHLDLLLQIFNQKDPPLPNNHSQILIIFIQF